MPRVAKRRSCQCRSWMGVVPLALALALASALVIGMSWPEATRTGEPASLRVEPYRANRQYRGAETASFGGFGLGWLATGTATVLLTPVATDTAAVTTPGPNTPRPTSPGGSDRGSPTAGQTAPAAATNPLAPAAQPTTAGAGAPAPGQPTLAGPRQPPAGSQTLPTAPGGAGLASPPGQVGSAPSAPATEPAEAPSGPTGGMASSPGLSARTGSPQGSPTYTAWPPGRLIPTVALVLLLIGLWVTYFVRRRRRTLR